LSLSPKFIDPCLNLVLLVSTQSSLLNRNLFIGEDALVSTLDSAETIVRFVSVRSFVLNQSFADGASSLEYHSVISTESLFCFMSFSKSRICRSIFDLSGYL
jgi:hypothetical protein